MPTSSVCQDRAGSKPIAPPGAGRELVERLGLRTLGIEGHDLKVACPACDSRDAGRIHVDRGVFHCYSCNRALSPFDLAKVILRDHRAAVDAMIDAGLFEPYMAPPPPDENGRAEGDPLAEVAREKSCSVSGLVAYGAKVQGQNIVMPMYNPEGHACSTYRMRPGGGKGLYEKGKRVGLFFPGRLPKPGEAWCVVEGCKDAAALHDLGFPTAGLPGNFLKPEFAPLFKDVDVVIVPDCDRPGRAGALKTAAALEGVAASVRVAALPAEVKETGGADVRDILKSHGDRGPDAIRRAIEGAVAAQQFARDMAGEANGEPPAFVRLLTSGELAALDTRPRFLVREMLVAGQPAIIGGRSKTLKTSIAADLVISVGSGTPFLGRFATTRGNVAFWSGESGAATIRETALRIAAARGVDLADCSVFWGFDLPLLSVASDVHAMRTVIEEKKLDLVVVDPLYLSLLSAQHVGRPSDVYWMGSLLKPLAELCNKTGATVLLCHHFRKNSPSERDDPPDLEELAQAGAAEFARQWVLLGRRSPYAHDGRHELWVRSGGSAGFGGLWAVTVDEGVIDLDTFGGRSWNVTVEEARDAREAVRRAREDRKAKELENRDGEHRDRLLAALRGCPQGETARRLRSLARLNSDNFERAVHTLIREGRVEECVIRKERGTYAGFRARER